MIKSVLTDCCEMVQGGDRMPYAKTADYRRAHAGRYAAIYREDKAFRKSESRRKADWYAGRATDPAWLADMAAKKRAQRAAAKRRRK